METDFGILVYFFDTQYARKPERFAMKDFENRKGILPNPFGYQLSFSGNIGFLQSSNGFRGQSLVSDIRKKVFQKTSKALNSVL